MKSVKEHIITSKEQVDQLNQQAKQELRNIDQDRRLTAEGKALAKQEVIEAAQQEIEQLTKDFAPAAEAAVKAARNEARQAKESSREHDQVKAATLNPTIQSLNEKELTRLYKTRAADCPTTKELIENRFDLLLDIKPESAEKQGIINDWQTAQREVTEKLPAENDINDQVLAAGNLRDYAEKSAKVARMELQEMQGKPLSPVEKVAKTRLAHETAMFEKAYK